MSEEKKPESSSDNSKETSSKEDLSNTEITRISTFVPPRRKRTWNLTRAALDKEANDGFDRYKWKAMATKTLHSRYASVFSKSVADDYFARLEQEVEYLGLESSQNLLFGEWQKIPRKHAVYGDEGLTYKFSGKTIKVKSWDDSLAVEELKRFAEITTGEFFNFVVVNRYKDGDDYLAAQPVDRKEIFYQSSIVVISFGQARDVVLRHKSNSGKYPRRPGIPTFKKRIDTGTMLIMEDPSCKRWTHSIPANKKFTGVTVSLTFQRRIKKFPLPQGVY